MGSAITVAAVFNELVKLVLYELGEVEIVFLDPLLLVLLD